MTNRLVVAWGVTQPLSWLGRRVTYSALLVFLLTPPIAAQADENNTFTLPLIASASEPALELKQVPSDIWQDGVGNGFKGGRQSLSFGAGGAYGVKILGTEERHNMALGTLSYGYLLGPVLGDGHWYKGNVELRGELWGGMQFDPSDEWVIGLTPHLRYDFATGTPVVPYFDLGAGVSATSIREPDLGQTFEFNLQAAAGVHWFITRTVALDLEVRLLHLSDAGMTVPNLGVNTVFGMLGVTWFF